jgi:SAM-dependent methyltransferase
MVRIEDVLRIDDLRAGFLRYSREAYARLPVLDRPRILDIGCGSGLPTIELARLSSGLIVGIDTDRSALSTLRRRIEQAGLSRRVKAVNASLFAPPFPDGSFDLLWEEGVLHVLDPATSLRACRRLLRPGGLMVMGETTAWYADVRTLVGDLGFQLVDQHLLPTRSWWTDYYAPLEANITALQDARRDEPDLRRQLARYERGVAMVKADPGRYDCGFFIVSR